MKQSDDRVAMRLSAYIQMTFVRIAASALLGLFLFLVGCQSIYEVKSHPSEQVILLHGLGRTNRAMAYLQKRIGKAGFSTHSIKYRSLKDTPDVIVDKVGEEIARYSKNNGLPVHFVGHSLGGLVVRAYLERIPLQNLGRVVLIGTPNQGSEVVDRYGDDWLFGLFGPTVRKLGTDQSDFPKQIAPPYYPLGIIAGSSGFRPFTSRILPVPNDGLVAVESTKLEGMTDFILVDVNHSMLLYNDTVAKEVIYFLHHGKFSRTPAVSIP